MADKRLELRLNTKTHSPFSVVSFILAIFGLLLYLWAVYSSAFHNEGLDSDIIRIGLLGIISMLATLSGIVTGIIGEFMIDDIRIFSHIGLSLHGILLIAHISILTVGY